MIEQQIAAHQVTTVNRRQRSRRTNKPFGAIDGRSSPARRLRDLVRMLTEKRGGEAKLMDLDRERIARAAQLLVVAEQLRARALERIDSVSPNDLSRVESAADRAVRSALSILETEGLSCVAAEHGASGR